jgi:hypothetical protein
MYNDVVCRLCITVLGGRILMCPMGVTVGIIMCARAPNGHLSTERTELQHVDYATSPPLPQLRRAESGPICLRVRESIVKNTDSPSPTKGDGLAAALPERYVSQVRIRRYRRASEIPDKETP